MWLWCVTEWPNSLSFITSSISYAKLHTQTSSVRVGSLRPRPECFSSSFSVSYDTMRNLRLYNTTNTILLCFDRVNMLGRWGREQSLIAGISMRDRKMMCFSVWRGAGTNKSPTSSVAVAKWKVIIIINHKGNLSALVIMSTVSRGGRAKSIIL